MEKSRHDCIDQELSSIINLMQKWEESAARLEAKLDSYSAKLDRCLAENNDGVDCEPPQSVLPPSSSQPTNHSTT
jgi:hypothetical protein